jgi:GNAT superfamily N-acetyltransferase
MTLSIAAEPFDSDDARRLVAELDGHLGDLYRPEQRFGPNLKAEHLADGHGTFLVARDGGRAVGCGAIRVLDPTSAEVKRMYVEPEQRGKGVGWAVLAGLEAAARQLGVRRLVLETGVYQEAAIALYRRAGFGQVECWGEYATSTTSVCYAKDLGTHELPVTALGKEAGESVDVRPEQRPDA